MTHQNHQTNGASLEDCHTNFFALADLCGIRWRQLVLGERPNASSDPLDDPVLRSYSKCLAVDILCVWRRVAAPKPKPKLDPDPSSMFDMSIPGTGNSGSVLHPPLSLTAAKELWIFWYGEEPDLTELVAPELLNSSEAGDKGSWENGLSYECRSLLFKALHNVIERCLLSRDVVRLGRWFVQPSSNSERVFGKSSLHPSFSFAFFVHGDSTVCASMDIREHPPVRPLMMKHLEEAQAQQPTTPPGAGSSGSAGPGSGGEATLPGQASSGNGNPTGSGAAPPTSHSKPRSVILAPFGLAATLTGQSYKTSDPQTQKVLDDWSAFYPISNKSVSLSDSADSVPPIVEIMIGGVKMRYPSKYVLVTDMDDWSPPPANDDAAATTNEPSAAKAAAAVQGNNNQTAGSVKAELLEIKSERSSGPSTVNSTTGNNQMASASASKEVPNPAPGHTQRNHKSMMTPPLTVPESPSNDLGNPYSMSSALINKSAAVILPERVWQDCIMHAPAASVAATTTTTTTASPSAGGTTAGAVTIKTEPKDSSSSGGSAGGSSNPSATVGDENSSGAANGVDANGNSSVWEICNPTAKMSCICIKSNQKCSSNSAGGGNGGGGPSAGSTTPYGGPPSYCRNPLSIGDSHPLPSEGSPASAAPSPMQPSSVSQPTSVPSGDQLMTMSPHPPASNNPRSVQPGTPCLDHLDKNTPAPTPTDQHDSKSITASPYHTPSHSATTTSAAASDPATGASHQQQAQQQQTQQQQQTGSGGNNNGSSSSSSSNSSCNSSASSNNSLLNQLKASPRSGTTTVVGGLKVRSESALGAGGGGVPMTPSIHSVYSTAHQTALANNLASKRESIVQMLQSLKRPSLYCKDYETLQCEDIPCNSQLLYDYSSVDAWMNHPVKRMRLAAEENRLVRQIRNLDLYANERTRFGGGTAGPGAGCNSLLMKGLEGDHRFSEHHNPGGGCDNGASLGTGGSLLGVPGGGGGLLLGQIKLEMGCDGEQRAANGGGGGSSNGSGDGTGTGDALLGEHEIKKEKEDKGGGYSLLTDQDLQPSIDDLNQIFDDGGPFNDDADMHNTPPGSNKSSSGSGGFSEEGKRYPHSNHHHHHAANTGILSPKELSQMFPTPPSLDPHPNSSPGGGGCLSDGGIVIDTMVDLQMSLTSVGGATAQLGSGGSGVGVSTVPNLGSPQEEPIDDWSFVFLPPTICSYVGSSKYAPLPNLPSQSGSSSQQIDKQIVYKSTRQKQKEKAAAEREKQKLLREQQEREQHQDQQQQQSHSQADSAGSGGHMNTPSVPHLGHPPIGMVGSGLVAGLIPLIKQELTVPQPLNTPNSMLGGLGLGVLNGGGTVSHHPYSNPASQGTQSQPHSRPPSVNSLPGGIMGGGAGMLSPSPAGGGTGGMFHPSMGGIPVPLRQGMSPISPATPGGSMRVPTPQGSCPLPYPSPLGAAGSPNPMSFRRTTPLLPPPPYDVATASPANSSVPTPSPYHSKQFQLDGGDGRPGSRGPLTPSSSGPLSSNVGPLTAGVGLPGGLTSTAMALNGDTIHAGTGANRSTTTVTTIETNALLVNMLLYDTALNIFRDHNFKSCTLCVCNAGAKCVGNIRGADSGLYHALPGTNWMDSVVAGNDATGDGSSVTGSGGLNAGGRLAKLTGGGSSGGGILAHLGLGGGHGSNNNSSNAVAAATGGAITINTDSLQNGYLDEDPIDCQCGFSAVVNRRMAHRAGLFFEDEMEITGMAEDPSVHKKSSLFEFLNGSAKAIRGIATDSGAAGTGSTSALATATGSSCESLPLTLKVMDLLREQCSMVQSSSNSIHRAVSRYRGPLYGRGAADGATVHLLEYVDANDVISMALEQGRLQAINEAKMDLDQQPGSVAGVGSNSNSSSSAGGASSSSSSVTALVKGGTLRGVMNVHKWPFLRAGGPKSNQDIVRMMKSMQPLLQDAFHKKCTTRLWDAPYTIQGPLTWRQFHRLAGRGTGQCEPQPIPSLIVGYEKDWLSLAPYALHYWDKLLLEPYSYPRDVAYVAIVPDNDYVVGKVRTYFKELSTTYEMCKLGRHTPIKGWDGVLRVGSQRVLKETQNSNLDEWFINMGADQQRRNGATGGNGRATAPGAACGSSSALNELLRLYAQTCQQQLAPYLSKVPSDKSLLDPPESHHATGSGSSSSGSSGAGGSGSSSSSLGPGGGGGSGGSGGSSMATNRDAAPGQSPMPPPPPSTPDPSQPGDKAPNTPKFDHDAENRDQLNASSSSPSEAMRIDDDGKDPPHIVLYIVEPFTCGNDSPDVERLACLSLLRCYSNILNAVPESIRSNISVQIVSLESILELGRSRNRLRLSDHMRCLALSVFSQSRKYLAHSNTVKSLTGFGTAANAEQFIRGKDDKNRVPYRLYTPPYVLAKSCEKSENTESFGKTSIKQQCSIMYCSYCLSEDQSWLLAVATDDRGEFLETVTINIDIPNRARRKRASARRYGLQKLMDFILGLISQTVQPWRLVVGRIGRIGHGELKGWSWLLSKPNLQRASKHLKDICEQCSLMHPISVPSILSACLVTLEPDSDLRVMSDQFTPDERFSQRSMQSALSTPQDATCTHILVFPTSAKAQSAQASFSVIGELDINEDLNMVIMDGDDDDDGINMLGASDLLNFWDDLPMQQINMTHSRPGSPSQFEGNQQSPGERGSNCAGSRDGYGSQDSEEVGVVLQQPLAIGYLVSTAPTGRMPAWFWSSCPHLENVCPVFLRTALHLHSPTILQNTDDPLQQNQSSTEHPLDSNITADVLRYVLEGYNLLSWLAMDSNTHDRLSCLPIHVQVLMQLYHMTAALA
ncbi:mediator of RNA polymerase II transcription subunit 13 [Anopheles cruzii]|uniref:mediator of RNA polymerase II transcription subunit 13 n=1 Tax=Anopheles cruzii TaxID=68878 RepID=UPI0022EC4133|nr:mediator of RNA polymerase II transcription subunit 13 [Anopheles cruzii]